MANCCSGTETLPGDLGKATYRNSVLKTKGIRWNLSLRGKLRSFAPFGGAFLFVEGTQAQRGQGRFGTNLSHAVLSLFAHVRQAPPVDLAAEKKWAQTPFTSLFIASHGIQLPVPEMIAARLSHR